jgi:hypothetical protein
MLDCDVNQRLDLEMTSVRNGVEHELVEFERYSVRMLPRVSHHRKMQWRVLANYISSR